MNLLERIQGATRRAPEVVGSPWILLGACAATLVWIAVGPAFGFSDAWLVLPATATSIGAFLLVLVLQYSQNRDTRAVQLKLDELIRSLQEARTGLVGLQDLSDQELDEIETEFSRLREESTSDRPSER
jgi:low affinity Fe/Cu permease